MSQGDFEDIRHRLPFVLTTDDLPEYNILYVGQQQEDELHCYVFDIAPKQIEGKKRYFQGRVWVDDHDFQIVKTYGKTVPDIRKKHGNQENLFPKFTTWRQQIDGQYWFPVYTKADDELHFKMEDVHIKEIVKYEDYKRFGANSKILYEGKEIPKDASRHAGAEEAGATTSRSRFKVSEFQGRTWCLGAGIRSGDLRGPGLDRFLALRFRVGSDRGTSDPGRCRVVSSVPAMSRAHDQKFRTPRESACPVLQRYLTELRRQPASAGRSVRSFVPRELLRGSINMQRPRA